MTDIEKCAVFERCAALNRWPAPAKLNLCLYVVGKRADGYHELETLFQLLDYGDELSFSVNKTGQISRTYDLGFSAEHDLCVRAARLLQSNSNTGFGVEISLRKRIPMGGGLGGGSSNAATVLMALNYLWETQFTVAQLAEMALELGADVPLFVHGKSAWGSGIGELLTEVQLPAQKWLVVTPNVNVSTALIFSHIRLTAGTQMKKIRALKTAVAQNAFDFANAENQLESVAKAHFPEIQAVFDWFDTSASMVIAGPARLSGSGGTVYAPLLSDSKLLSELLSEFKVLEGLPENTSGFIASGVNSHPLRMQN